MTHTVSVQSSRMIFQPGCSRFRSLFILYMQFSRISGFAVEGPVLVLQARSSNQARFSLSESLSPPVRKKVKSRGRAETRRKLGVEEGRYRI